MGDVNAVTNPAADPPTSGPAALFALMTSQHGVASSTQARDLGVSRAVERRLVREGALIRVLPGILAAGGVRPSFAAQAMAASLCEGVVAISHGAAARLHRLAGFADHPHIEVVGERPGRIAVVRPVRRHYAEGPIRKHLVRAGAIPVTSIPLTLTLLAAPARRSAVAAALTDALGRGVSAASIRNVASGWPDESVHADLLLELLAVHGDNDASRRSA